MSFRIIKLPPFKAASSGVDMNFDFSPEGILGKFNQYFSKIKPHDRDDFIPRDFLFYDPVNKGLVWWYALTNDIDAKNHEVVDFYGGLYLTFVYKDGDDENRDKLLNEAYTYIKNSNIFVLDERPNHYNMGHIITPQSVIEAQGWAQMEAFIPIKLI